MSSGSSRISVRRRLAAEQLQQQVGRTRADLALRDTDRGQRRLEPIDERHVVEADDRDVLRAPQAAAARVS